MIDILQVLRANELEVVTNLKDLSDNTMVFGIWNEEDGVYDNADDCPYIRISDDDGNISSFLVVALRYNEEKHILEIIGSYSEYEKAKEDWFPLNYADDISYWQVLDATTW